MCAQKGIYYKTKHSIIQIYFIQSFHFMTLLALHTPAPQHQMVLSSIFKVYPVTMLMKELKKEQSLPFSLITGKAYNLTPGNIGGRHLSAGTPGREG